MTRRHSDNHWGYIVRWSFYAMLIAEEKGITQANVDQIKTSTQDLEVRRLLSLDDDWGKKMGLSKDWAYNIIEAVGIYFDMAL